MQLAFSIQPLVLIIRDGWGNRAAKQGNAVARASTPITDHLLKENPHSLIQAAGESVGFPKGFMGNSECGHLNIGAGRPVLQEIRKVDSMIKSGAFFSHEKLRALASHCRRYDATFHLMGLCQDAGVHAHIRHLYALLDFAKREKLKDVAVHVFTDGRDTHPMSSDRYVAPLIKEMQRLGVGQIETIAGRFYSMDRDNRWDRIKLAYDVIVQPDETDAPRFKDPMDYVKKNHRKNVGDEFFVPSAREEYRGLGKHDTLIHFNYRNDRAIQMSRALLEKKFDKFPTRRLSLEYLGLTKYYDDFKQYVVPPFEIRHSLGEVLSQQGLRQLRIAETEKYKHVTSWINGKRDEPFSGESRVLVPSPKVRTYDLTPEMRTREITDIVEERLLQQKHDVYIVNFAAPDMVGHTGDVDATVEAVEAVDWCVGRITNLVNDLNGATIVTSDHGNCEDMTGERKTSHTTNPVDCMLVSRYRDLTLQSKGILGDIAPTMLDLLNIKQPGEMQGRSLLRIHPR